MKPGSVLVLYTDGIFERENHEEEPFGIERLKQIVKENQEKTAEEIVGLIYKTAFEFGHQSKWEDDTTVVILKRLSGDREGE